MMVMMEFMSRLDAMDGVLRVLYGFQDCGMGARSE